MFGGFQPFFFLFFKISHVQDYNFIYFYCNLFSKEIKNFSSHYKLQKTDKQDKEK